MNIQLNLLAHHHFGQGLLRCVLCIHRAHQFAFAQDGHSVGDFKNLIEFVGNNDNRLSVLAHFAKNVE